MKIAIFLKSSLLFNSFYCLFLFINKSLRLNNSKTRTAIIKISVFIICVEAIIYLLLYRNNNLIQKERCWSYIVFFCAAQSFPISISSVSCGSGHIYWKNSSWNSSFFVKCWCLETGFTNPEIILSTLSSYCF